MFRTEAAATSGAPLPAGNFSQWLRDMRGALAGRGGMDVACGDCRGCCVSSYYIKVRADETATLARIGVDNLEPGPPGDPGSRLMGFRANGHCLVFKDGGCSIYPDRPETCRAYDCRVFKAAGMDAGPDKPVINQRIARWAFDYAGDIDRDEQRAVAAAASYLRQHPVRFPHGHVPSRPGEVAVLALKAYTVFLEPPARDAGIRAAIVEAVREFEQGKISRNGADA